MDISTRWYWRETDGTKAATSPADFLPNPEERRRQSCFNPTRPQKTRSTRIERAGWPSLPASCTRRPCLVTQLLSPATTLPWHPSLEMILLGILLIPFLKQLWAGQTEFFVFLTLAFEKLKDAGGGGGWPCLKQGTLSECDWFLTIPNSKSQSNRNGLLVVRIGASRSGALRLLVFWPRQTSQETPRSR